ncbi:hypothetical protein P153DRAFT_432237 [Dothidotthia symphoricarpi CBS 119687]|uniref:Transcription factor TFIIIB component B'' Myb domain-containing protein n=1 Tax=Dothidotthia symphoricarpi CBS 119687 TaxID=1392245 RepID=A0A6A6A9J5_9PLEO|nr:uncharacterized protein P153DRAFT_432237 [Dothidotthia symphoricarpi CBS 119687]KAF2128632.1 hypothetical protein P153DRAFT_432237 [Dothidotthia symphoricarpi CBS 119687]
MSAEDGADKTQAPKPAPTFTSFINKNTSGKKVAPKAARRRAPIPPTPSASTAASTAEPPTSQTEPEPTPPTVAQLPTPAATQEPAAQNVPQPETSAVEPLTAPSVVQAAPSPATQPVPTPVSTNIEAQHAPPPQPSHATTPQPAEPLDTDRPAKRRRTQPPAEESTAAPPPRQEPESQTIVSEDAHATVVEEGDQQSAAQTTEEDGVRSIEEGTSQPTEKEAGAQQSRKRTRLPWVAVNHAPEDEPTTAPAKRTRQPARARGKAKAVVAADAEEQEGDEEDDGQPARKRPRAKARNKRGADEANADGEFEVEAPAKKPRKPRKKKAAADGAVEGEAEPAADATEGATTRKPRKPRQPRRRIQNTTEGETADGEEVAQPKRKGRPPREDTPPEAEHQTIDPETTFMDSLASRNIRVGKLSNLERRMRGIDWDEVKQRQREEDRRIIHTKETQAAVDKLLNAAGEDLEAANAEQGPRMRVVGDRIELIHDSGTIDREAEADMHIATMEVHEEADLTTRITTRSFMKNGKRFPNDFLLPGQGHRWTQDQTDRFYHGLRMYGTDFQMISMMFPNLSRRVVKTKFTREERENPDKVAQCLLGELEMASGWGAFLQASELQDSHFADADEIKRQMDEVEVRMRVEIEAAKAETAERKRQLKEAGLLPEGEEGAPDREDGKGRKKRREKGKQVTFREEEGVEILGGLDEDPNWGQ